MVISKSFTPNWSTKGKPFRAFLFHIQNVHAPYDKVSSKLIPTVELMRWEGWWFLGKLCDANSLHFYIWTYPSCCFFWNFDSIFHLYILEFMISRNTSHLRRSQQLAFLNSERSWIVLLLGRNHLKVSFGPWCVWVFLKLYWSWLQCILMCQFKNSARFPKMFTQDFSTQCL